MKEKIIEFAIWIGRKYTPSTNDTWKIRYPKNNEDIEKKYTINQLYDEWSTLDR